MQFAAGVEKPQGAENSALKNTAPFSLTPLRIWENASIGSMAGALDDLQSSVASGQSNPSAGRPSKSLRRSGMVVPAEASHNCSPEGTPQVDERRVRAKRSLS